MPSARIVLEGDGHFAELQGRKIHRVEHLTIAGLEGGMASGAPSVALVAVLPDGSAFFGETSLKVFLTAADALKARYGDPR
jgi:hypothetical protein